MMDEKEIIDLATASVQRVLDAHVGHITNSLQGVETRLGRRIDDLNAGLSKLATDGCTKGAEMRAELRSRDRRTMLAGGGAGAAVSAAITAAIKFLTGGGPTQ